MADGKQASEGIECWTDYPFLFLGDKSGQKAPVRKVLATHYDRDKYVRIVVEGRATTVKSGYLYAKEMRFSTSAPRVPVRDLPLLDWADPQLDDT